LSLPFVWTLDTNYFAAFFLSHSQTIQLFNLPLDQSALFEGWLNKFHMALLKASLKGEKISIPYSTHFIKIGTSNIHMLHTWFFYLFNTFSEENSQNENILLLY